MEDNERTIILLSMTAICVGLFLVTQLLPYDARISSNSILLIAASLVLIYIYPHFILDPLRSLWNCVIIVVAAVFFVLATIGIAFFVKSQINIIVTPGYLIVLGIFIAIPSILLGVATEKLLPLRENLTTVGTKLYFAFTSAVTFAVVVCISYLAALFAVNYWCEPPFPLRSFSQASIVLFMSVAVLYCLSAAETEIQKVQIITGTNPSGPKQPS